jgi:hypothetical protein
MNTSTRDELPPGVTAGPNDTYIVDVNGHDFYIGRRPGCLWGISPSPIDVDLSANWVVGYATLDEAIETLIGDADRRSAAAA